MEVFGPYQLAERIEQLDTWELFRAYTSGAGLVRPVALRREPLGHPTSVLREEAQLLARLSHPNVPQLLDAGERDGYVYVATSWVPGRPLSALIQRTRQRGVSFDLHGALYIVIQTLQGLSHAHEMSDGAGGLLGIVHRDVGPHSIAVGFGGQVSIGGFGYAQYRGRASMPPAPGQPEPRWGYASPELALGDTIDHRSDIFGMGLLLYELLAGKTAFEAKSPMEARARAQRGVVPPLGTAAPHLPVEVIQVVERALVFDRNLRHPSAQVFRDELQRLLYTREPTYGPHRLASLAALLLGDDASEDLRKDQELRGRIASQPPAKAPSPAPAPIPPTPAFGVSGGFGTLPGFGTFPGSNSGSTPGTPAPRLTPVIPAPAPTPAFPARPAAAASPLPRPAPEPAPPPAAQPAPAELRTAQPRTTSDIAAAADAFDMSAVAISNPSMPDPLAMLGQGAAAPVAAPLPASPSGPVFPPNAQTVADPASAVAAPPAAFVEPRSPLSKIVAGVAAVLVIGALGYTFSSEKRTRTVTRKVRAAVVGRKPGGVLTVESIPPGARLFLDDEDTGRKTPVTIENLESEILHDVSLELAGEPTETATVVITAGQKKTINIAFKNAVSSFSVKTDPPGADLFLDGRNVALTPASLSLRAGQAVAVKITKIGHHPFEQTITPERGKPVNLDLVLEKTDEMKAAEAAEAELLKAAAAEEAAAAKKAARKR